MSLDLMPWIELALRWLHVITGIAWIGASFYFIWLDNHLEKRSDLPPGVAGDLWAVHGGGFYHNQKYLVAPAQLPPTLHWFKYEAYFTWISGFLLLCALYYYGASIYLIDSAKLALAPWQAVAIGLACLAGGWLLYDGLCRAPLGRNNALFGAVWFLILCGFAYGLTHTFTGRGAFIHVGAIIGTAMVGNVFFVIIPNQKKAVAEMIAGRVPEARLGQEAKQRSLHNNYMTLPVLLIMISNHYPMITSGADNWIVLAALSISGLFIRHFFNLRHKGIIKWELWAAAIAVFVGTMFFVSSRQTAVPAATGRFADARAIIGRHCVMCHSAHPTHAGITAPPAGLDFTQTDVVVKNASRIQFQAVANQTMPLGNETHMTQAERATLGAWIAAGAKP